MGILSLLSGQIAYPDGRRSRHGRITEVELYLQKLYIGFKNFKIGAYWFLHSNSSHIYIFYIFFFLGGGGLKCLCLTCIFL